MCAAVLREAVQEVLADPARYDTLYVVGAAITGSIPVDADPRGFEKVYLGYDDAGTPVGFAIPGAEPGFQDLIRLLFGYDPRSNRVIGMRILESKETPGLGDKIEKDAAFVAAFERVTAPIQGVKVGRGQGDEHEIDMITGATISSRTVIAIINHRLEALGPLLDAYIAERRR